MKKRIVILTVSITVLIILATASIASAGEVIHYIPYLPHEDPITELFVSSDDTVYVRLRWGACNYGMAHAFTRRANIYLEKPSTVLVSSKREAKPYWAKPVLTDNDPSACLFPTDGIYTAYWDYLLDDLTLGPNEYHVVYWLNHRIVDGLDSDGDGKMDVYPGVYKDVEFTVYVMDSNEDLKDY